MREVLLSVTFRPLSSEVRYKNSPLKELSYLNVRYSGGEPIAERAVSRREKAEQSLPSHSRVLGGQLVKKGSVFLKTLTAHRAG